MVAIALAGATAVRELVADDDDTPSDGERAAPVDRVGSTRVDGSTGPLSFDGNGPSTWKIRYRVAAPGSAVTEDVLVRAPFESHTEVRKDGEFSETRETALGISVTKPTRASAVGLAPAPEAVGFRPGPVVDDAVDKGLLVEREQRTVASRPCQVFRTSSTLGGATFAAPSSETDYVDICVDTDGLLLELVEVFEGEVIRQRVALDVKVGVDVADADVNELEHEATIPANQGGGSVRPIDPATRPVGPFLDVDAPPVGYTRLGRYEVIPPQPDIANPETRGKVVAAVSDVFVNGPSAIVVERGARLDKGDPWEPDDKFPDVDLGQVLGEGEFVAGITGAEVRALLGDGRFVRVYGTASLDELVAVATAAPAPTTSTTDRRRSGGERVGVDGAPADHVAAAARADTGERRDEDEEDRLFAGVAAACGACGRLGRNGGELRARRGVRCAGFRRRSVGRRCPCGAVRRRRRRRGDR